MSAVDQYCINEHTCMGTCLVFNPRLARNVESENESTLKVKMKVGFSLFILLRPSQARVLIKDESYGKILTFKS